MTCPDVSTIWRMPFYLYPHIRIILFVVVVANLLVLFNLELTHSIIRHSSNSYRLHLEKRNTAPHHSKGVNNKHHDCCSGSSSFQMPEYLCLFVGQGCSPELWFWRGSRRLLLQTTTEGWPAVRHICPTLNQQCRFRYWWIKKQLKDAIVARFFIVEEQVRLLFLREQAQQFKLTFSSGWLNWQHASQSAWQQ